MITADQGISYQQNMKERKISLVVLSVNREKTVLANAPRILAAIDAATVGSYTLIDCR